MANLVVDNVSPDGNGLTHIRQLRGDGVTIIESQAGVLSAVGAAVAVLHERLTPNDGQVVFPLQQAPLGPVKVYVNGLLAEVSEYGIAGNVLTWYGPGYGLAASD